MPNWMKCRLYVKNTDFDAFVRTYVRTISPDDLLFDFNLISQMPKDLEIPKGSMQIDGLKLAATKRCNFVDFYGSANDKLSIKDFRKWLIKVFGENAIDSISSILLNEEEYIGLQAKYKGNAEFSTVDELGERCVNNVLNYGYKDWYDWAIDNWGVKWNAHHCDVDSREKFIEWNSPWTYPLKVLLSLSQLYPSYDLELLFAEERVGYLAGRIELKNGKVILEENLPSYSKEAYQMYDKLWNTHES